MDLTERIHEMGRADAKEGAVLGLTVPDVPKCDSSRRPKSQKDTKHS